MVSLISRQHLLDGFAVGASALCMVHCLALPALILVMPALAAYLALPEAFHEIALAIAIPSSALALWAGYRRHGQRRPMLIVVPGLVLLSLGAFVAPSEWLETTLTVLGTTFVAGGHVLNWRAMTHGAT